MRLTFLGALFFLLFVSNLQSQSSAFQIDSMQSKTSLGLTLSYPLASGELGDNLVTLYRGIDYLKGKNWKWLHPEHKKDNNFLKGSVRFLKLFALDGPIAANTMIFNHEFTGHALTAYDVGYKVSLYYVPFHYYGTKLFTVKKNIPPTTNEKNLPTAFVGSIRKTGFDTTYDQEILLNASGVASSDVLRYGLQKDWQRQETLDYNDALVYLAAHFDYTNYLLSSGIPGDTYDYVRAINLKNNPNIPNSILADPVAFSQYGEANFRLNTETMSRMAVINAVGDPYTFFSLGSIYSYIVKGKQRNKLPYFKIKEVQFMPSFGAHLSPFGLAYTLRSPIRTPNLKMHLSLNYGKTYDQSYYGIGIDFPDYKAILNGWNISPRLELFNQPKFQFGIRDTTSDIDFKEIGGIGGLMSIDFERNLTKGKLPFFMTGRLGFKTAGYVPGESIRAAPLLSVGISTFIK